MDSLSDKTLFITGGSRGIGRAIALKAAADGANIVIAAKTRDPHPKLPGTIHSVSEEIAAAGGNALPLEVDVRDELAIHRAVEKAAQRFGGIDVLVNNASAVFLADAASTPMKRYDLMFDVNVRGTFAASAACIPYLIEAPNGHILTLSPPLNLEPKWFGPHTAYTMSKYGMSMTVLGLAEELAGKVAVNALWPKTMIYTAASKVFGVTASGCRTPEIMADAAHHIVTQRRDECTGNFLLDEDVLVSAGETDFVKYESVPGAPLQLDLFL